MPKKTKKEKLLAQKHRSLPLAVVNRPTSAPAESVAPAPSFALPTPPHAAPASSAVATVDFLVMKRDLVRTLIITASILISEVLLARTLLK